MNPVTAPLAAAERLLDLKRLSLRWMIRKGIGLAEAEDIFQQSLLKAMTAEKELRDGQKLQAWFMSILKNTFLDHVRAKKLHSVKEAEFKLESGLLAAEADEIEQSFCKCVSGYLGDLSESERTLLQAHFFDGKSFAELAGQYGESASNLRVKSHRAREKLRAMLKDCCGVRKFDDLKDCGCG